VTYGGQTMLKAVDAPSPSPGNTVYLPTWCLNDAGITAAASDSFSRTWGGAPTSDERIYGTAFFENVHQINPIGDTDTAGEEPGNTVIATGALSTNAGDMVLAAAHDGTGGALIHGWLNGFAEAYEQPRNVAAVERVSHYKVIGNRFPTTRSKMAAGHWECKELASEALPKA